MAEDDIDLYGEYEDDQYEEPVRFCSQAGELSAYAAVSSICLLRRMYHECPVYDLAFPIAKHYRSERGATRAGSGGQAAL